MATLQDHLRAIQAKQPFASVKINHGYWERLLHAERLQRAGITDSVELDRKLGQPYLFETDYHKELSGLLASPTMHKAIQISASPYAWPGCERLEGTPAEGLAATLEIISRHLPSKINDRAGLMWKSAAYDGSIVQIFEALRDRDVICIGPPWLDRLGAFARFEQFRHLPIDPIGARKDRLQFFEQVVQLHDSERDTVYLVQAGSYSPWLILKLFPILSRSTFLDLGVVTDICYLPVLTGQNWSRAARQQVAKTIVRINPAWPNDARFFSPETLPSDRLRQWRFFSEGILTQVAEISGLEPRATAIDNLDRPSLVDGPADHIENKKMDFGRIFKILSLSRKVNHWTNFGPVSIALELALAQILQLPETRVCIMCGSGTSALFALAGLYAAKIGRSLRWVTSSYGFRSLAAGPFAETTVYVDCKEDGFIDLDAVSRLPADSWDGLIVTNVFGLKSDLETYRQFALALGKKLICDNAAALLGVNRSSDDGIDEAISFHQTKPWGIGEGGCAIIAAKDVELFRSLLNGGINAPDIARRYALNGKMSDLSAAAILERLECLPSWHFFYERQRRRIESLAGAAGFRLLGRPPAGSATASVPLLSSQPISLDQVSDAGFVIQKYYKPIVPTPKANEIYERILNIPCHPGMAAIPTEAIQRLFDFVASKAMA